MASREQKIKKFAELLLRTRYEGRLTQEQMADSLGVSKRTIENWENGRSIPNFIQCVEWFENSGINPFASMIRYFYPDDSKVTDNSSIDELNSALRKSVVIMSREDKLALFYLIYGNHGSSYKAVLQLLMAHLHIPLKDRIASAALTAQTYEMEKQLGNLIEPELALPNDEILANAIEEAKKATVAGFNGYVNDIYK